MDSKILTKLDMIEDHAERLRQIEQLLEEIRESNRRSEKYLQQMFEMYQQAAQPQQRGGSSLL